MAQINQIYNVVNSLFGQSTGSINVTETDLTNMVSLGDKVVNSEVDKDIFFKALFDANAGTIISTRSYTVQAKNVVMNDFEYGMIVRKLYIKPLSTESNESWELEDGTYMGNPQIKKPTAVQKLFSNKNTFEIEFTVPDYQLSTAFQNAEEMGRFLAAIFARVQNDIAAHLENLINMCICNFIAEKMIYAETEDAKGIHAINLLADYGADTNDGLTLAQWSESVDFYKWCSVKLGILIDLMSRQTEIFNVEGLTRHTPKEDLHFLLLTDFARGFDAYLQSTTFHNEYTKLPLYDTVSYWQGMGTDASFGERSKISVKTSSGTSKEINNVVGFLFDRDALGVMVQRNGARTQYYPKVECTQYWEKFDRAYFNDLSENAVVLYLA